MPKKCPSPPGADPLDLRPNRVNPRLLSPGGDPDLFPLDVEWIDLFHDKGHISRASAEWMERFLQRRLELGDDPSEIACRLWMLSHAPVNGGSAHFLALLRLDPRAAQACLDGQDTPAIFSRLGDEFAAAAQAWTPPQDLAYRGWSASRTDREIRDASRQLFGCYAKACQASAARGLPQMLRLAAHGAQGPWSEGFAPKPLHANIEKHALVFALASIGACPEQTQWGLEDKARLGGAACLSFSLKSLRRSLVLMAPEPAEFARVAGQACLWALSADERHALPECLGEQGPRFLARLRGQDAPSDIGSGSCRAVEAIRHFASWIGGGASPMAQPFIEGLLGEPFERADGSAMERFLELAYAPSDDITSMALAWAHARRLRGLDSALSAPAASLVWQGHFVRAQSAHARFAQRHLALAKAFPSPAHQAQSVAMASAPIAATIEAGELSECLDAYVANPALADSEIERGGLEEFEAPKARRPRL